MSGTLRARTAPDRALRAALTVLCVMLLCLFGVGGAGPSTATAEGPRSAPSAPAEPTEAPADPVGDPEVRVAVRVPARAVPGVRGLQRPVFHVKPPRSGPVEPDQQAAGAGAPTASLRAVRGVVLRC
ncbi:hypothetical protein OTB20_24885 [Streptomyces sp. H27-H1]|uniref:hypothetical protein n=1 Tax=Streptomyces sp. H27-H1 TaxID=2996461 RepID=UPI00226DEDB8|nr:hypothetical protein [Streptomyces sp. H27-H1]MCY0929376.1 hypothetical protein [Streptomyces sp. H27-H1]